MTVLNYLICTGLLLKKAIVNLRPGGIRTTLDDFGTGFSSVGLLKEIPIDTIKADRSFVMRIQEDERIRNIMRNRCRRRQ